MNSITNAMAQAGIPLPTKMERLWKIVKDHPGISAKAAGAKAHITMSSSSSLMSQMENRGMVTSTEESRRIKLGQGFGTRKIKVFTVARGMDKYELLPAPRTATAEAAPAKPTVAARSHSPAEAKPAQPRMTQTFAEVFMHNHSSVIQALHKIEPNTDLYTLKVSDLLQICAKHGVKISFS